MAFWGIANAPVAQLDRAPDFGSVGRGFESLRARQFMEKEVGDLPRLPFFVSVPSLFKPPRMKDCPAKFAVWRLTMAKETKSLYRHLVDETVCRLMLLALSHADQRYPLEQSIDTLHRNELIEMKSTFKIRWEP